MMKQRLTIRMLWTTPVMVGCIPFRKEPNNYFNFVFIPYKFFFIFKRNDNKNVNEFFNFFWYRLYWIRL